MGNTTRGSVIPQRQLPPTPGSARSRFGQKRSAPARPSVICAAGCHRVIVPRPKGQPTTGELDASTTTYWNGGTPKASLHRRHHPLEGRPGVRRSRARPPARQVLVVVTDILGRCRLGGYGGSAAARARPTPALLRAGS